MARFASVIPILAVGAAGLSVSSIRPSVEVKGSPAGLEAHESQAGASLIGQFRTSVSSWLWLRTDLYLHGGVEMRVLSPIEASAGMQGVGTSDPAAWIDESKLVTLIPDRERDFRGIFGEIERAAKAYREMKAHSHETPEKALPLFRLMTWIDPKFVPAWTVGANIISRNKREGRETALKFLRQGLSENPDAIGIRMDMARLYATGQDFEEAIAVLNPIMSKVFNLQKLDEEEGEALLDAYRWMALSYRELGDFRRQRSTALAGLRYFPEDRVLRRLTNASITADVPLIIQPPDEHDEHDDRGHAH